MMPPNEITILGRLVAQMGTLPSARRGRPGRRGRRMRWYKRRPWLQHVWGDPQHQGQRTHVGGYSTSRLTGGDKPGRGLMEDLGRRIPTPVMRRIPAVDLPNPTADADLKLVLFFSSVFTRGGCCFSGPNCKQQVLEV